MTQLAPGDVWKAKGAWARRVVEEPEGSGTKLATAAVSCPVCGEVASLRGHAIGAGGYVTPSLVCPNDCGFHDFVQLAQWGD